MKDWVNSLSSLGLRFVVLQFAKVKRPLDVHEYIFCGTSRYALLLGSLRFVALWSWACNDYDYTTKQNIFFSVHDLY
jgi:hypothetical protein